MTRRSLVGLLFALLLFQPLTLLAGNPPLVGTVSYVYDGDTLEISPLGKVRLIGIDAPEHEDSDRDLFYRRWRIPPHRLRAIAAEARRFLIDQVKGQRVSLTLDHTPRDKYGRLLAYVHLADGRLLNELLLEKGFASVFRKYDFRLKERFLQDEERARHARRGLWQKSPEN